MVINIGTKLARITPQEGTAMKLTTQIKATQTITPQLIGTMTILSYSAKELGTIWWSFPVRIPWRNWYGPVNRLL